MHRRAVLKLISLATTASFASTSGADLMRPGKPTPETAQDLDHLASRYQALYHSTAPTVLMTPVVAHLETLRDLLRQGGSESLRRRLLTNQARVATLAGRLAFLTCGIPSLHGLLQPRAGVRTGGGRAAAGRCCPGSHGVHPSG